MQVKPKRPRAECTVVVNRLAQAKKSTGALRGGKSNTTSESGVDQEVHTIKSVDHGASLSVFRSCVKGFGVVNVIASSFL
jgi:hypothetical protein